MPTAPAYLTLDAKRDLCSAIVTLDGKPAKISGYGTDFAMISDFNGRTFQWTWTTAAVIVARGGQFRS